MHNMDQRPALSVDELYEAMQQPTIKRVGKYWQLTMSQWLNHPRQDLFAFFADAHNLEIITPSLLRFRVVTPAPIQMKPGTLIDYKLNIRGIPLRWRTLIQTWQPCEQFTDEQIKDAVADGVDNLHAIQSHLGAATGCGTCSDHAQAVIDEALASKLSYAA